MLDSPKTEDRILEYIKQEIEEKGYPPSVREICQAIGLRSTSTVHSHLNKLEAKGLIRRDRTKPRALEVTDGTLPRGRSVPLVGKVTAGQPILAIENIEGYMSLPSHITGSGEVFGLRVEGESMIDAGIFDGDIVVLRQQTYAENGDIVVAMIAGEGHVAEEATIKRIFYEEGHVRLQPENHTMEPIIAPAVQILGKLVALVRQF